MSPNTVSPQQVAELQPIGSRMLEVSWALYRSQEEGLRAQQAKASTLLQIQIAVLGAYVSALVAMGPGPLNCGSLVLLLASVAGLLLGVLASLWALWPIRYTDGFPAQEMAKFPLNRFSAGGFDVWLAFAFDQASQSVNEAALAVGRRYRCSVMLTAAGLFFAACLLFLLLPAIRAS